MKKKRLISTIVASFLVAAVIFIGYPTQTEAGILYKVKAKNGFLIRKITGDAPRELNGVPSYPVHSFAWNGDGVEPLQNGNAVLTIDAESNIGQILVHWRDRNGNWEYRQTVFSPPPHPTGLRIGSSADETVLIEDDPATANVYLHGNTGAGGPVLPTVSTLLATWGPPEIKLNGMPFVHPTKDWIGHTMTTEGVRGEDGTVRTATGGIYNHMASDRGATAPDDLEFHLVFHEIPGGGMSSAPPYDHFPPHHEFFYHVMFEDVKVEIEQPSGPQS